MSEERLAFESCDRMVAGLRKVIDEPVRGRSSVYYTGVDLGTACVVIAVLDEDRRPVAGAMRYADVVRDGMVVDYIGAVQIVRELKERIEDDIGAELVPAAGAIPPGTDMLDGGAVKNVIEGAGFECTGLFDESTAANEVLGMRNGVIVDIGGGTTGISVLKDGKVVYTADEPTGGTHFSLVISGAYGKDFDEAERFKRDEGNHRELIPVVQPVIEKVASIINMHIEGHQVDEICLVGGTSCFTGIEDIIGKRTGICTRKPEDPMLVTPLGIALSCRQEDEQDGR